MLCQTLRACLVTSESEGIEGLEFFLFGSQTNPKCKVDPLSLYVCQTIHVFSEQSNQSIAQAICLAFVSFRMFPFASVTRGL